MFKHNDVVIVGGGLSSLLLDKWLSLKLPTGGKNIHIVEIGKELGGQFKSFNYDDVGYFDQGMHIYYDTCEKEIDDLIYSTLPADDWNVLEGNHKDIAGIYFRNKLQVNTPYPYLNDLPKDKWKQAVSDLMWEIKEKSFKKKEENSFDFSQHRFGTFLTEEVYRPLMKKLFHSELEDLDLLASTLLAVNRVSLFDAEIMDDFTGSQLIRSVMCYPDQLKLPQLRSNQQRGLYPKKFGFTRVIDGLIKELVDAKVNIHLKSQVAPFDKSPQKLLSISINTQNGMVTIPNPLVIWNAGMPSLMKTLGQEIPKIDTKPPAYFVNMLFEKPLDTQGLYYFYCFEPTSKIYRLTDYSNYCPLVVESLESYPISLEYWSSSVDEVIDIDLILEELKKMEVLQTNNVLKWHKIEKNHGAGFPLPTTKNIEKIQTMRNQISAMNLENVVLTGALASPNIFFIKDILLDMFKKVKQHGY